MPPRRSHIVETEMPIVKKNIETNTTSKNIVLELELTIFQVTHNGLLYFIVLIKYYLLRLSLLKEKLLFIDCSLCKLFVKYNFILII